MKEFYIVSTSTQIKIGENTDIYGICTSIIMGYLNIPKITNPDTYWLAYYDDSQKTYVRLINYSRLCAIHPDFWWANNPAGQLINNSIRARKYNAEFIGNIQQNLELLYRESGMPQDNPLRNFAIAPSTYSSNFKSNALDRYLLDSFANIQKQNNLSAAEEDTYKYLRVLLFLALFMIGNPAMPQQAKPETSSLGGRQHRLEPNGSSGAADPWWTKI